jgi:hypothetical protein
MRTNLGILLLTGFILPGCSQNEEAVNEAEGIAKSPGRYAGIGTFEPGRMWTQVAGAPASKDRKAATLADDEHIIVVLDSHTGEVRQCGDHSGICVAMNPWSGNGAPILAPTPLTKHAADLDAEAKAEAERESVQQPSRSTRRK